MDFLDQIDEIAYPSQWAKRLGFHPDPWQKQLLDSESRQIIANCSRQIGKSQATAVKVAHRGLHTPDALILLVAPSERQSIELMHKSKSFIEQEGVKVSRLTRTQAEFENGSRIYALPGKEGTIRGYSGADLVVIDEAAWAPSSLYYSIRPMLAVSNGQIILLSTPHGKMGFFHDVWMGNKSPSEWHWPWNENHPDDGWERISINATQCPRISPQFLDGERQKMPQYMFKQEYMCEFAETQDSVFAYDDIMAMFDSSISQDPKGTIDFDFDDGFKAMKFK